MHGDTKGATPVWVRLDRLFPRPEDAPRRVVIDGLDLLGDVPGFLVRWERAAQGEWLAVVNYSIRYADGRSRQYSATQQLVPAHIVRPRA